DLIIGRLHTQDHALLERDAFVCRTERRKLVYIDANAVAAIAAPVRGQRALAHPLDRHLEQIAGAHPRARQRTLRLLAREQSVIALLLLTRGLTDNGGARHIRPVAVDGAADIEAHEIAAS